MKREIEKPAEQRRVIRLIQSVNFLFARTYHRVEVLSAPQLPARGAAILVCNHTSGLDPLLIQAACRRVIVWMMASEYYQIRGLTWFFRQIEAIPVDRSGRDLAATRAAFRALSDGRVLGVFPEGRIETTREALPFQTGVALMAIKTGVPVYPAYLDGTQRGKEMLEAIFWRNRATLRFGPPVGFARDTTSREALEQATQEIRQGVLRLRSGGGGNSIPVDL